MTREEQIRQAGIEYTIKDRPMCICGDAFSDIFEEMNRNPAFEEGAKWADETMVAKACEWLKIHIEDYYAYDAWRGDYIDIDALIKGLKKYLGE